MANVVVMMSKKKRPVRPRLEQCKRLIDTTGEQFIELHSHDDRGLPYSASFRYGHMIWKLHGQECLLTIGKSYVAVVSIDRIRELNEANDFDLAGDILRKNLTTRLVLYDQMQEEMAGLKSSIERLLLELGADCSDHSKKAEYLLHLLRTAEKRSYEVDFEFCKELCSETFVHSYQLTVDIVAYAAMKNALKVRNGVEFADFLKSDCSDGNRFLREALNNAFEIHRSLFLQLCPSQIKDELDRIANHILLSPKDALVLCELECVFNGTAFESTKVIILNRFIESIDSITPSDYCQMLQLNEVYPHICKGLFEGAARVGKILGTTDVIDYIGNEWSWIAQPIAEQNSNLYRCFKSQLCVLIDLANHFEPGKPTAKQMYPYVFQIDLLKPLNTLRSEQHLWLCLMDSAFKEAVNGDLASVIYFTDVLKSFRECVTLVDLRNGSWERLRKMTHETLELAAQVHSLLSSKEIKLYVEMVLKQFNSAHRNLRVEENYMNLFCDYTSTFLNFWKKLSLEKLSQLLKGEYLHSFMEQIQVKFLDVAFNVLKKNAEHEKVIELMKECTKLLTDLDSFPFEWYVQFSNRRMEKVLSEAQIVTNIVSDKTQRECYVVSKQHYQLFVEVCDGEEIPVHFQLETVLNLQNCLFTLMMLRQWNNSNEFLTANDQLKATTLMMEAMRNSLFYLKEQPNYLNFIKFSDSFLHHFRSLISECHSMENFKKRVAALRSSLKPTIAAIKPRIARGPSLKLCKRLMSNDKEQYITERSANESGLPYSAKFRLKDSYWKLHGEQCLITVGTSYVAVATISPIKELNEASDFDTAQKILLNHVKIEKVLAQENHKPFFQNLWQQVTEKFGRTIKPAQRKSNVAHSWMHEFAFSNTAKTTPKEPLTINASKSPSVNQIDAEEIRKRIFGSALKHQGQLTDVTDRQYIKLRSPIADGLPYSAQFDHEGSTWTLHGEERLLTIDTGYVAQVSIESVPELNDAGHFNLGKAILLKHLVTEKVLLDEAWDSLKAELLRLGNESVTNVESVNCLIELNRVGRKHKYEFTDEFIKEISSKFVVFSEQLRTSFIECSKFSSSKRRIHFNVFEALEPAFNNHKQSLLKLCSSKLAIKLNNLEPHCCMLLGAEDVKLFSDLECALNQTIFGTALPQIIDSFVKRVRGLEQAAHVKSIPLVNGIYFHVCKGLVNLENLVKEELYGRDIVRYQNGEWRLLNIAKEQIKTPMSKCLLKQLAMFVAYANHFEPGRPTVHVSYPCRFRIDQFQQMAEVHHEYHLWLALLDLTMVDIFEGDIHRIEEYSAVTQMFVNCLSSNRFGVVSHESIRTVTHNTLELVALIEQSEYGLNDFNKAFLDKQIHVFEKTLSGEKLDFNQYRDFMDAFKVFWERYNCVIPNLSSKMKCKYLQQQFDKLEFKLMNVILRVLDQQFDSNDIIRFFRMYNDFILDLKELRFEWYVRPANESLKQSLLKENLVIRVDNLLGNTHNECFQVNPDMVDKFVAVCSQTSIPKHYQIEVMHTFLDYTVGLADKQTWKNGSMLTKAHQINAVILLINAIRSSLLYLKEQPDYVDFEKYHEETTKPLYSVIEQSDSMENFEKRVELVKESFWYIRNQNSIRIDVALQRCKCDNDSFEANILKMAFELYTDQYERYLSEYRESGACSNGQIQKTVEDVCKHVKPRIWSEWTADFKQNTIPTILAGLAAVWSIMVSEDVASSGSFLKPHPIQILSVLRLLCVDENCDGIKKHLAQIFTGQGKSLTLGLVAAVLALFGHDVVIVCYSDYLASRDSDVFFEFYRKFSISSKVSYQTFQHMVYKKIDTFYTKAVKYLRECIGLTQSQSNKTDKKDKSLVKSASDILLIDEVDVFFIDTFYGNTWNSCTLVELPGLGLIQQTIWELVQEYDIEDAKIVLLEFIKLSSNQEMVKFRSLMHRNGSYNMIVPYGSDMSEIVHTNESLFLEHLTKMLYAAAEIHNASADSALLNDYRIDTAGRIRMKDAFGKFILNWFQSYNNTFVYFKLRKSNFIERAEGYLNFGYMIIRTVAFSFSRLPETYSLILGVTGTLNGLSSYEQSAIENHYNIKRKSIMPSYFGGSYLTFSSVDDFKCTTDEISWRRLIFTRVNEMIDTKRSVIVFFDSDLKIKKFKQDFANQLDRLHELTTNTEDRERYITEAGHTRTITLATREMGRGVDYKSSLLVEKNGGIHIIQTFFSLDVKEETQIKGRTARKDNHGSYELIVCQEHLVQLKLIPQVMVGDNNYNYCYLTNARDRITTLDFEKRERKLEEANARHEKSIQFVQNI
nr:uncharacterized protein LOC109410287 [Aedes albopictus]